MVNYVVRNKLTGDFCIFSYENTEPHNKLEYTTSYDNASKFFYPDIAKNKALSHLIPEFEVLKVETTTVLTYPGIDRIIVITEETTHSWKTQSVRLEMDDATVYIIQKDVGNAIASFSKNQVIEILELSGNEVIKRHILREGEK